MLFEPVTKEEVREALQRLGLSILGLKQGWSGADLTRHIDVDVGVLFRFISPLLEEPPPAAEPAPSEPGLAVVVDKAEPAPSPATADEKLVEENET